MSDNTPLAISDAESVYNAVYQMLKEFTGYPEDFTADSETIKWGSLAKEGSCIGLFPMQGAFYLNQYVSGSYVAQFPFQLAYKSSPTENLAKIDITKMLENLGQWMESDVTVNFYDSKTQLQSFKRVSPVLTVAQDDDSTTYAINIQLNYFHKKG